MPKLTERKAIEISLELWTWLAANPLKGKEDFPKYVEYGIAEFESKCPLCELRVCELREGVSCTSTVAGSVFDECPLYKRRYGCATYHTWSQSRYLARIIRKEIPIQDKNKIAVVRGRLSSYWRQSCIYERHTPNLRNLPGVLEINRLSAEYIKGVLTVALERLNTQKYNQEK